MATPDDPRPQSGVTVTLVPGPSGTGVVVVVAGEIDSAEADEIDDVVRRAVAAEPMVLLDLSGVRFFGSAGLALVVESCRAADGRGVAFAVVTGEGNRAVTRPLSITGVDAAVAVHPTVDAAHPTVDAAADAVTVQRRIDERAERHPV